MLSSSVVRFWFLLSDCVLIGMIGLPQRRLSNTPKAAEMQMTRNDRSDAAASIDVVEQASLESFPASDPPAWIPVNGARANAPGRDNRDAEIADFKDRFLRALAEQENLRRRAAREREQAVKFAATEVIKDLLPTIDNLGRGIESARHAAGSAEESMEALLAGIVATERGLLQALATHGITAVNPSRRAAFDPAYHHAIFEVSDSDCPPGTIAEVIQPGYRYHDRLLRPALVGIAEKHGR
jgi:molecular chaperone GrpE